MSHKSLETLKAIEATLSERLKAVRVEIREREASAATKLAKAYAKVIVKARGELPSPEQLAAILASQPEAPKRPPRSRKPKA